MQKLSKKDIEVMSLAARGGQDAQLMLLDKIHSLEEKVAYLEGTREAPKDLTFKIDGVEKIKGERGLRGEVGERGYDGKDGKNGKDGKDGESIVGQAGKDGIDGKDGKDGRDGSQDMAEDIRNKLELLQGDERLNKSAIKGLEEELKRIEAIRGTSRVGGGTSAMGVAAAFPRILHKETPTGDIDSVNLEYSVNHSINAVVLLSINGQIIEDSNYSVSGRTITFTEALPAALSGTAFRVVYL